MSMTELKAAARKILESTTGVKAPNALVNHLLIKENRPQLLALAKHFLLSLGPIRKAPNPHARRRVGPHRKKRERILVPTSEQKIGALTARARTADLIFEHKLRGGKMLGEIRVHELQAIAEAAARSATQFLERGYEDATDTFLCAALADHCVAADPFGLVKDAIKASDAAKMLDRAKLRAAEVLRDKSAILAKELIAIAHSRPEIGPAA